MGIYSDALNQTLQSPMTGMAIGLLGGAAPGGTMAGGMQQGLLNSQGMASNQAQIAEREHRMGLLSQEEARRAQALERLNTWADSNPVGTPASTSNFEQDLFPGEQPTQGLLNETPATGMYALNPQKAAMQQGLIQANPALAQSQMAQTAFAPPTPMSDFDKKMIHVGGDLDLYRRTFGNPGTNIELNTAAQLGNAAQTFDLGHTKNLGENISANAISSRGMAARANLGKQLLQRGRAAGNETGKWNPFAAEAASWLGVEPEAVQNYQMMNNLAGREVMNTIQQTKGSVSEKEMEFFEKINVGSDKDPLTNYILFEIQRRIAERHQAMPEAYREYLAGNNSGINFDKWFMENRDPYGGEFDIDQLKEQYAIEVEGVDPAAIEYKRRRGGR